MAKKILYIWKDKYPWDVRVAKFCNSLAESGYEIHMLARSCSEELQSGKIDNVYIYKLESTKNGYSSLPVPFNPRWKRFIRRKIAEINPDLIIIREIMLAETAGKIAKENNIPIIMDMAENYPAAMREWKKYNSSRISKYIMHNMRVPDIVEKRSLRHMDGVIVVCVEQIERLFSLYLYPKENMCLVHNTPAKDLFKRIKKDKSDKFIIGHHGHLTAEKSINNLILGFAEALQKRQDIELHIWGDGECFDDYKMLIESNNISDSVKLKGAYEYSRLNDIINGFDLGAIPYQISDFNNYTIHNKIFDYFACGKPVLVSEAEPLQRIIHETKAGTVVDCESPDAIAEAILNLNDDELEEYAKNAYKAFQDKYNWETDLHTLQQTIDKYLT